MVYGLRWSMVSPIAKVRVVHGETQREGYPSPSYNWDDSNIMRMTDKIGLRLRI